MSLEIKKLEELGTAVANFRAEYEDAKKKNLDQSAEFKAKEEKMQKAIDSLTDEVKTIRAAAARPGSAAGHTGEEVKAVDAYQKAMKQFMRGGGEASFAEFCKGTMAPEEFKALSTGSDVDGGYMVVPEVSQELVKKVFETSPMRQLASVQTISSNTLEIVEDIDEAAASWVAEVGTRSATATPAVKKIVIPAHEIYAAPLASQQFLDDAFINAESWLMEKVMDKFARTEATAFISGDGSGKPMGILSYASGTGYNQIEQVVSGTAATIADANGQANGLIDLRYSLKSAYLNGAAFLAKRATIGALRKLKDSHYSYIWQPALSAGAPDTLFGYPIYEANDMQAEGAGNLAVAFGNFKAGYQIVDRVGMRVLRDPYSSKPYVMFYTTKRVGGAVKNFEAIKLLKCST